MLKDNVTAFGSSIDTTIDNQTVSYTENGKVELLTSLSNTTVKNQVKFEYDIFGHLKKDHQAHSGTVYDTTPPLVEYTYNAMSKVANRSMRLASIIYPTIARTVNYSYDNTHGILNGIKDGVSSVVTYHNSGMGNTTNLSFDEVEDTSGNNLSLNILGCLDIFGRVSSLQWSTDLNHHVDLSYSYDLNHRKIAMTDNNSAAYSHTFTYDNLKRLNSDKRNAVGLSQDWKQEWGLGSGGNWNTFTNDGVDNSHIQNESNEITSIANVSVIPTYDDAGNMTYVPQPNNMESSYTLTYDAWNRLVKIQKPGPATTGSTTISPTLQIVAEYTYDARNFRITKEVNSDTTHFYYSNKWQVIEQRENTETTASEQYIWGSRYVDELMLRDRDTTGDGTLDEKLYALQDMNYNTVALINISSIVQERFDYTAYGKPVCLDASYQNAKTLSIYDFQILHTGQRLDPVTGLHLFRNRWYCSEIGKFTTRDPEGYVDGFNLYSGYFSMSQLLDPSGNKERMKKWSVNIGIANLFVKTMQRYMNKNSRSPKLTEFLTHTLDFTFGKYGLPSSVAAFLYLADLITGGSVRDYLKKTSGMVFLSDLIKAAGYAFDVEVRDTVRCEGGFVDRKKPSIILIGARSFGITPVFIDVKGPNYVDHQSNPDGPHPTVKIVSFNLTLSIVIDLQIIGTKGTAKFGGDPSPMNVRIDSSTGSFVDEDPVTDL